MARILVAMSGGVDSSVAAALLQEQGHEVIGGFMQVFDYSKGCDDDFGSCCSPQDCADARRVAEILDFPFYTFNMEEVFKKKVIDYFIAEYLKGRTPNPCIYCNSALKFEYLLQKAVSFGADYIATGHYAITEQHETTVLKRGVDSTKDQSYFLFNLAPEQLKKILFPLGGFTKTEIREMARKYQLPIAEKEESQEICFVPDDDYGAFIEKNVEPKDIKKGNMKTEDGKVLCKHDGIHRFTIGQRKGLGVAMGYPAYVTKIDAESGDVIIGKKEGLYTTKLTVENLNFLDEKYLQKTNFDALVQIRYRSQARAGKVVLDEQGTAEVTLEEEVLSVTPGQAAVFYEEDRVIGGGWIVK